MTEIRLKKASASIFGLNNWVHRILSTFYRHSCLPSVNSRGTRKHSLYGTAWPGLSSIYSYSFVCHCVYQIWFLVKGISVISTRWKGDNKRLCIKIPVCMMKVLITTAKRHDSLKSLYFPHFIVCINVICP